MQCTQPGTALQAQAHQLQHDLQQVMRRFGRQCRGMGKMVVTLVRQTETQLLELGYAILPLARAAQQRLHGATPLSEDQRARLDPQLTAVLEAPQRSAPQSRRLTQSKGLTHGNMVHAYDPTMAPMCKGKSHGPGPVWPHTRNYC